MPRPETLVPIAALADYPDRVDVRSPSEFCLDHAPSADNRPVLDDTERARVGTIYVRESPFLAKKIGAALVARNIARMLDEAFAHKPREWHPLVYCWRGGQRSRALTHVLNEIGWKAAQLEGGYRAYRRHVAATLEELPRRFSLVVICGPTGSGKSRLLSALASQGAQVLDLEALACHRGSLLGNLPDVPQPSQKLFETHLLAALQCFDTRRPVYVEAESRRIGAVQLPSALLERLHAGKCVRLDTALTDRVAILKDEYRHFLEDAPALIAKLRLLSPLHGKQRIAQWEDAVKKGAWEALIASLLSEHYDPAYQRSIGKNFPQYERAHRIDLTDMSAAARSELAQALRREFEGSAACDA